MSERDPMRVVGDEELKEMAAALGRAWERAETIPAPSKSRPHMTIDEAYVVQELVIEQRMAAGRRRAGWKLGLTSSAGTEPIAGTLLDDMIIPTESRLSMSTMVAPLVEAEISFVAGERISPAATLTSIAAGPHAVAPAIEVIDYRTRDADGSVDWVADNSTVAFAVVGEKTPLSAAPPLGDIAVELFGDEQPLATGAGSLVMGDPLLAIQWLLSHLGRRGRTLEQGDVVLTGSLTGHHAVAAGREVRADFHRLGSVAVHFTP